MAWVAGVDGCRSGWVVALIPLASDPAIPMRITVCKTFVETLALPEKPSIIAVDIPIGLLDEAVPGGRNCDRDARKMLQPNRGSSVFPAPTRRLLPITEWRTGLGVSKQSFAIKDKIREVDDALRGHGQDVVHEIHPEISFRAMSGQPMCFNKKTTEGQIERFELLMRHLHPTVAGFEAALDSTKQRYRRADVAMDDILDACAAAWSARRIATGVSQRVPATPPRDSQGLEMAIWW